MNTNDHPINHHAPHSSYEFPDAGHSNAVAEDDYFVENLFDEEGAFGEGDCIGL